MNITLFLSFKNQRIKTKTECYFWCAIFHAAPEAMSKLSASLHKMVSIEAVLPFLIFDNLILYWMMPI